jgi:hypothetical protein
MAKNRRLKLKFNPDDGLLQNIRKHCSNGARSGVCIIKHSNLKCFRFIDVIFGFMGILCFLLLIFTCFGFLYSNL